MSRQEDRTDVVVVGGGNAGFSAAIAAAERGRRVVLLEKSPHSARGGNSYYTAGAFRITHDGLGSLGDLIEPDPRHAATDLPSYTASDFQLDMKRVTNGSNDQTLTDVLVDNSADTLRWLHGHGLRFRLMYERQAYPDAAGRHRFWGGLAVGSVGGGVGLIEQHADAAARLGVEVRYEAAGESLLVEDGAIVGVVYRDAAGKQAELRADSVILSAGGFEADATMRRKYLGEGWERAKVRGNPLNTGDMLRAALDAGAAPYGDWTTCHSVAWDANAPENGSRVLTNQLTRGGYFLGIVVNINGERFIDEGSDYRNYTYAKYGAEILKQPEGRAFQIYDATTRPMLRSEEYDSDGASVHVADSLEELAASIGVNADAFLKTVQTFNANIDAARPFDASTKDGRSSAVEPPKSNWAVEIKEAPFYAFPVTCGITFTFGGLRADDHGRVLKDDGSGIPGLYVCGEMLGGLFSGNYPGGSGLTSGAVFGRRAGSLA
ncbi:FAD-dependent tricarballylate dehydrogenase TcuA [Arthrobacter sp. NPDC057013]|uniref:FAD-dependent tricarballylate dehydrogenase TcuA n=1 Tax=Arthrobacter sp. NPDC057013 TaxID=3345999 RepID=UPI0036382CEB